MSSFPDRPFFFCSMVGHLQVGHFVNMDNDIFNIQLYALTIRIERYLEVYHNGNKSISNKNNTNF